MVKIRLKRMGMRHRPTYRVVVMDSQRPRDGEYIESLGHYDPRTKQLALDVERARYWQSVGAQPTQTVGKLIKRAARTPVIESPAADEPAPAREAMEELPPEVAEEAAVELAREQEADNRPPITPPPVNAEPPEPSPTEDTDAAHTDDNAN